jgi:hypothetical protein
MRAKLIATFEYLRRPEIALRRQRTRTAVEEEFRRTEVRS